MVSLHAWTSVCILLVFFLLAPIADSKKHRAVHHHKHRHHHRVKHPKLHHHQPVPKNQKPFNMSDPSNSTSSSRKPTPTTTSNKSEIARSLNLTAKSLTTLINLKNETSIPYANNSTMKISETDTNAFPSTTSSTFPNSSLLQTTSTNAALRQSQEPIKELQKLFPPTNPQENLTSDITVLPNLQLTRKKRSTSPKAEKKSANLTLLDLKGPLIQNYSDEGDVSSYAIHKRVKRDHDESDTNPSDSLDSNYLQNLEDSFALSALEIQARNFENSEKTHRRYQQNVRRKRDIESVSTEKDTSITVEKTDGDNNKNFSGESSISKRTTQNPGITQNTEIPNLDNSILNDDESIVRNSLDDMYPTVIDDPENPSPTLVRTKRFDDGIMHEIPDVSYVNEVDSSQIIEEPYAEDNRIIDSMLSKVDYGIVDESNRSPREPANEADNNAPAGQQRVLRYKRKAKLKSSRKKISGKRRKHKKGHHKGRHKGKKHRSKNKPSKSNHEMNSQLETKRDVDYTNFRDNEEVVSPHDDRRRREFDETNDDMYPDNKPLGRVRRDLQDSANIRSLSETVNKVNTEEAMSRDKRESGSVAGQELKYFQNVREANVPKNESARATEWIDKASGHVQDIKQLVDQLYSKVKVLHGYVNEDGEALANTSDVNRISPVPPKLLQRMVTPGTANVVRHPQACCKSPTAWKAQSESSKPNTPVSNPRVQRCGRKSRTKRNKTNRKWDRWTDWSSCSVTCGRGRQIRWRHCVRNCSTAETEMEEKACQLPACAPGKFLGIFG